MMQVIYACRSLLPPAGETTEPNRRGELQNVKKPFVIELVIHYKPAQDNTTHQPLLISCSTSTHDLAAFHQTFSCSSF
jgi:hypothetical protein